MDRHRSRDGVANSGRDGWARDAPALLWRHGLGKVYGLPAAARGYFGMAPAQLSWAQASMLAGLVQAPSAYDPIDHPSTGRLRQRHVLNRLVATHVLSPEQANAAFAAPLGLR